MGNTLKFILEYNEYLENIELSIDDDYIFNEIKKRTKFDRLAIYEGLIKTYPLDKTTQILKKRFPNLKVEIEQDGEIYIENQPPRPIKEYLPLITNLGYFIATLTINGDEWIKEYNDDTKPIGFILEPKYDYEVQVPKKLYHASPIRFKDKILKIGLTPKSGSKVSNHPERVYLSDSILECKKFAKYLIEDVENEWYKNGYCIYSIDGDSITKLYSDINFRIGGYYTSQNIKPEYIKLILESKL